MLKISASMIGCFSGEKHFVELDPESCLVRMSSTSGIAGASAEIREFKVSSTAANSFSSAVAEVIAKPENLIGGRSTTVYKVVVTIDGAEISAESSEIPIEELIEIASDPHTKAELKQKIESALIVGYHNWAHELFRLTYEFVANFENANSA